MPYVIHDPATVESPRDCVDKVKVFFNGGYGTDPYSLAIVTWQGTDVIGIRWNVNQREWDDPDKIAGTVTCVGEPNSRGHPTWFILPLDFLKALLSDHGPIPAVVRDAILEIEALQGDQSQLQ